MVSKQFHFSFESNTRRWLWWSIGGGVGDGSVNGCLDRCRACTHSFCWKAKKPPKTQNAHYDYDEYNIISRKGGGVNVDCGFSRKAVCACTTSIQAPVYATVPDTTADTPPQPPSCVWFETEMKFLAHHASLRMDPVLWSQTLCRRNKSSPPSFLRYCSAVLI
jgi:hypothetical protein